MFRKLIANISFSPALVGQLGFYARRLRKEEATRRVGLIFTALALVVQSFAVFSPPESANAANPGDLVRGGLHTKAELLRAYDNNTQGIRELFDHAKISRASLVNAKDQQIHSRTNGKDAGWLSWNRVARFGLQRGETSMQVGSQKIYVRPLAAFDVKNTSGNGSWYPAFTGTTTDGKPFALMKGCANILLKYRPPSTTPSYACMSLTATRKSGTRDEYTFKVNGSAKNGATIHDYVINYGDSNQAEVAKSNTFTHTYKKPGIYTVKSSVRFNVNGKIVLKTADACTTKVVVEDKTPAPTASCSNLQVTKINRTKFRLTAQASTQNGASTSAATFVVRDNTGKEVAKRTVKSSNTTVSTNFTLTTPGEYSAAVTFTTSLGDKTSDNCQTDVVIESVAPCPVNPNLPINSPECQPCPADEDIWYKDEACSAKIMRTKSAQNITTDVSAENTPAKAGDKITYTLTVTNKGKAPAEFTIKDDLADVIEYATLHNMGGGTYDNDTASLSWPTVTLKPGDTQTRMYTVRLPDTIPAAPKGTSDPSSYDCRMTNVFGNTVDVAVDCPAPKVVEQTVSELPTTGPAENMLFAGVLLAIVAYFYARSRQLRTEVRLIRRGINTGTI